MIRKKKLARAIAMALAGSSVGMGSSGLYAATTMYNTYVTAGLPNVSTPSIINVNGLNNNTDGWTRIYDTPGDTVTPGIATGPESQGNKGTLVPWVGTAGGALPFGFTGSSHLNWAVDLAGAGDSAEISTADSSARYSFAAELDTGGGAWRDTSLPATGWKHQSETGLIRSSVTQQVHIKLASLGALSPTYSEFGVTVFQGMDTNVGNYSHHGAWNNPVVAKLYTADNPFGTTGLSNIGYSDQVNTVNELVFTAVAGQIYTIHLGGVDFAKWNVAADNYKLNITTSPATAQVTYNTDNNSADGSFNWNNGDPGYSASLPASWVANINTNSNVPVTASSANAGFTIGMGAKSYKDGATDWGHSADFGLFHLDHDALVTITVKSDASDLRPAFGLWSGWATGGSRHGAYLGNGAVQPMAANPLGSGLVLLDANAWAFAPTQGTPTSNASATLTRHLKAGNYTLILGGYDGTVPGGNLSYSASINAAPVPVREDNDGDKHADILWWHPTTSLLAGAGYGDAYELLSDVGAAVPTAPITVLGGFAGVPIPSPWAPVGRGDYNGDGKSDILWGNSSNQLYIALRTASSPAAYSLPSSPLGAACAPATSSVVGTGDYNGDSKSDILLKDAVSGNISVLLMYGTSILNTATCATTFAVPPTASSVVKDTGDYDGDGKADILWGNSAGQLDVQYTGTSGTTTLSALSGLVVEGSGNFDDDATHKSDLLLRSTAGDVSIKTDVQAAPSTAGTPISAPGIIAGANVPNSWKVKGTGDYDGDGKNDVLWRNTSSTDPASGYNFIFLMNGAIVRTGVSNFLPAPYDTIPVNAGWDISYTQTQ